MKYLNICLISTLLLTACYKSAYQGPPPPKSSITKGVFQIADPSKTATDLNVEPLRIKNGDVRMYMFEQQALFKARLDQHAIKAELNDKNELNLNIPGNLSFSINSASINWNMHAILDKISTVIRSYIDTSVTVIGHSDGRGDPEINEILSQQRAMSIADYLIRTGVKENRLIYYGVGSEDQLASNDTTANRSLNRRVQIILTPMIPRPVEQQNGNTSLSTQPYPAQN